MTPNEGILLVLAIAGWIAFGISMFLTKDSLEIVRFIYRDAYGVEMTDDEEAEE